MKRWQPYALLLVCLLLTLIALIGCGQDQSSKDDTPPSAPVWITRTPDDTIYAQQGIRPEPVQNDATHQGSSNHWVRLEWYANPESDVITYRVWRISETLDPRYHAPVKDLRMGVDLQEGQPTYFWVDKGDDPNNNTSNNLAPDPDTGQSRGFFWELQAIDSAGNRSPLSTRVYYRLLSNPFALAVTHDSLRYQISYQYDLNNVAEAPLFDIIRVYPLVGGPGQPVAFESYHRYEATSSRQLNFFAPLTRDCTYVCQINVVRNVASESHADSLSGSAAFTTFKYQP